MKPALERASKFSDWVGRSTPVGHCAAPYRAVSLARVRSITHIGVGLASLAGAIAAALLAPAMAQAAPGDITFSACIADTNAAGCTVGFQDSLAGASGVAVSPDGSSVYVVSSSDNSISHFTRTAGGSLTFAGCIADTNAEGCMVPEDAALSGAYGVAVSPDGSSVYVTSQFDNSISHFTRFASGSLEFVGCDADTNAEGCTVGFQDSLNGASGVAVSPDGSSVYVASYSDNSVSHFTRTAGGSLTFAGCIADTNAEGCIVPEDAALAGASGVAVSPDGSSVYVVSPSEDSISHFTVFGSGSLAFAGCDADTNAAGCDVGFQDSLNGASGVAISPDGSSVYVASFSDNSISHFTRTAGGSLTFAGCIADTNAEGCTVPAQAALDSAFGVAMSPDGSSVYVASEEDDSISHFARAAGGSLAFAGCIADTNAQGCAVPAQAALAGALGVAVSPGDGRSVYVASEDDDSVSHFTRELPPPPADPPTPAGDTDPPGVTLSAKKVDAGKPLSVTVACDEACSVELDGTAKPKGGKPGGLAETSAQLAAGAPQVLKLKPTAKLKRKLRNAGKGKAAVEAVATDAAGNRASDSESVKLK